MCLIDCSIPANGSLSADVAALYVSLPSILYNGAETIFFTMGLRPYSIIFAELIVVLGLI
jgi:hypothetical protein